MPKKKEKKKEQINPEIYERELSKEERQELMSIAQEMKNSTVTVKDSREDSGSYFKSIVASLDDEKRISANTEYLGVRENFAGTRLEFFSQYAYMPFLNKFVNIFETKRVSLQRKGRKEKIMALQERHQEIKEEKMQDFAKLFSVMG